MTIKQLAVTLAISAAALSCTQAYVGNDTDIDTAVKMTVENATACSATLSLSSTAEVSYYILAGPVLKTQYDYLSDDAVGNLKWIQANGKQVSYPYEKQLFSSLDAGAEYLCGWVAVNAEGTICSAPTFNVFKTGTAQAVTALNLTSDDTFTYSVTMNDNAKSFKYVFSTEKSVTSLNSDDLEAYVKANGKDCSSDIVNATYSITEKSNAVVAAVAYDEMGRTGEFSCAAYNAQTTVAVIVDGKSTKLAAKAQDVEYFTGRVNVPAKGNFVININGLDYGFTSYSGNGGVGTVNNVKSAVPFYNLTSDMTWKFYVEKSMGQMTKIDDGGNEFWTNMTGAGQLDIIVDMTGADGNYRYFFYLVNTDSNRVFYEGFDMAVWGSNYHSYTKGTGYNGANYIPAEGDESIDGTEPGVSNSVSTTGTGIDFITWPASEELSENEVHPGAVLMKNLGLDQWGLKRAFLISGCIRLGNSKKTHYDAWIITPPLSSLTGATDVTVTTELYSFAGGGQIEIAVLGAGKFTKAVLSNTAGVNMTCVPGETNLPSETVCMIDGTLCPKQANATVNKTVCKAVLSVQGATSQTRIKIYVPERTTGSEGRTNIDYIMITK